jgi:hypothetical protein
MTTEIQLNNEIERITKLGGCGDCNYKYSKWSLCYNCKTKIKVLKSELKVIQETKQKIKEIINENKTRNIVCEELDVESSKFWIDVNKLKKEIK